MWRPSGISLPAATGTFVVLLLKEMPFFKLGVGGPHMLFGALQKVRDYGVLASRNNWRRGEAAKSRLVWKFRHPYTANLGPWIRLQGEGTVLGWMWAHEG